MINRININNLVSNNNLFDTNKKTNKNTIGVNRYKYSYENSCQKPISDNVSKLVNEGSGSYDPSYVNFDNYISNLI